MNMKKLLAAAAMCLLSIGILTGVSSEAVRQAASRGEFGGTTLQGASGYIVVPSAEPAWSEGTLSVSAGYSLTLTGEAVHIPYLQFGFAENFEINTAFDFSGEGTDLLVGGKWRFSHSEESSMALGFSAQMMDLLTSASEQAVQLYFASTFPGAFIKWPAKTTLLLGYTIDSTPDTNIDFGMGFQTPFLKELFNERVDFLLDFGNVSYSHDPNAGRADRRGLVNTGFRLLPASLSDAIHISADVRALDLLDEIGRAVSLSVNLTITP